MHAKHLFIDSPRQAISNDRWHTTRFLTIEELCSIKNESLKYDLEAPYLSSRSYKLALKTSKEEKIVANKKLQVGPKFK